MEFKRQNTVVCARVANVIDKWLAANYFLVDEGIADFLRDFVEKFMLKEKGLEGFKGKIMTCLKVTVGLLRSSQRPFSKTTRFDTKINFIDSSL